MHLKKLKETVVSHIMVVSSCQDYSYLEKQSLIVISGQQVARLKLAVKGEFRARVPPYLLAFDRLKVELLLVMIDDSLLSLIFIDNRGAVPIVVLR